MKKKLHISQLAVGHFVVGIASQKGNFTLTSASHITSVSVIKRLIDKQVTEVFIDPRKTQTFPKNKSRDTVAKELKKAKRVFEKAKDIQRKVFSDTLAGSTIDVAPILDITNQTIDAVFEAAESIACVVNIRDKDEYLLEHSISVSVYMTLFAKYLKINRKIIEHLAIGAFLHDVGKIRIPDEILNKPGRLTDDEFVIMKSHASHSINILKKTPGISKLSLEVAALHHEKLNGQGYPNQVAGNDISKYGRMVAICDIFDALTANRVYKDGFTHHKAFTILRELVKDNHLDGELVEVFIRCIGAFPIGSLVKLGSDKLAIIERANTQDPIRPTVRSFYSVKHKHFVETKDIDLTKSQDFIEKAVRADDFNLDMNKITEMLLMMG